jgi:anti-sigma-K factor RskA
MTCEELRQEYASWALGIAEDPERSEIAAHLESHCPLCVPGVRSAMIAVAAMAGAVEPADPPQRLRRRVIQMIAPEPKRRGVALIPWAIAGVLAIALISVALPGRMQKPDTAKLEQALSILNDPAAKDVSFGDPAARGRVFVSATRGVVLVAAHLPALAAGRTFELWVIPARGNPIPAGTFRGESDATAVYVRPGPVENAAAVAVTVEPEGGSPQPTTTPFIVTRL